jgi:uncharacterized protein with ATP-grasp and redox domains
MNLESECLECLLNQAGKVAKNFNLEEDRTKRVLDIASSIVDKYSRAKVPPPVSASELYPKLGYFLGKRDLYEDIKEESTKKALEVLDSLDIENMSLKEAIKTSVGGNVIDLATPSEFDLIEEFKNIFHTSFAISDEEEFLKELESAKSFLIVGDNVGEHIFDKLLLEKIKEVYPDKELYYAVRGVHVINDVTLKEAKEAKIDEVATILDSGVDTPGLEYSRASEEFLKIYNSIDLILAKGMGNYECLEGVGDRRIYHLFKVKCEVVARSVGAGLGSLIFQRNC